MNQLITKEELNTLLQGLSTRFFKHPHRHPEVEWTPLENRLRGFCSDNGQCNAPLWSLFAMERTGGEPDVISALSEGSEWVFCDCSAESPKGRRSICYDREGLELRKEHKPHNTAVDMAVEMGVEILDEQQYLLLQQFGNFDSKSSSWLRTSPEVRMLGGALFGSRRFGRVFFYANGAQSYYGERAFRALVRI